MFLSFTPTVAEASENCESPAQSDAVYVGFTSDVHDNGTSIGSARMESFINNITTKLNSGLDNFCICGDLAGSACDEQDYWEHADLVMNIVRDSSQVLNNGMFICGNHEYKNGNYEHDLNDTTQRYSDAGTSYIDENYILYSLSARQQYEIYSDDDINAMKDFLEDYADFDGPIFILSHFPLHCYDGILSGESQESHDGKAAIGAAKIIALLNNYPNVIYLWGHNHSDSTECYDTVYTDKINLSEINFTYASAGCMCDTEHGTNSAAIKGKGLVAAIYDGYLTLSYCSEDGTTVGTTKTIITREALSHVCNTKSNVSLTEDTMHLILESQDTGEYTFRKKNGSWTIQNEDGKFLGLTDGTFAYSDTPVEWIYSNGQFQKSVVTSKSSGWGCFFCGTRTTINTYYLTFSGNSFAVSTDQISIPAAFEKYISMPYHTFGIWEPADNNTHKKTCEMCGNTVTEQCCYDDNGTCTVCGRINPGFASATAQFIRKMEQQQLEFVQRIVNSGEDIAAGIQTVLTGIDNLFTGF